ELPVRNLCAIEPAAKPQCAERQDEAHHKGGVDSQYSVPRVLPPVGVILERLADEKSTDKKEHRHAGEHSDQCAERLVSVKRAKERCTVAVGNLQRRSKPDQVEIVTLG